MSASEHNFTEDVLKSGEALDGFTADGAISARKAVTVNGDKQVTEVSSAGSGMRGVAVYDVADGEEVAVAIDGCEVDIEAGGSVSAGDAATTDADGNFVSAGGSASGDNVAGIFLESGGDGDIVTLYIDSTAGVPQ